MNLTDITKSRYSTKSFDPAKKIADTDFDQLKSLMQFSPSSINLQPWHMIIANTDEGKTRLAKGTQGPFIFNEPKVLNASHVVLFAAYEKVTDDRFAQILDQEEKDGRHATTEVKTADGERRNAFRQINKADEANWHQKNAYLNLGAFLLGAGALGIDAVPMEGIDITALNTEFGLEEKGMSALVMVALGYRAEDDFNAKLPKSRLPQEAIFTQI